MDAIMKRTAACMLTAALALGCLVFSGCAAQEQPGDSDTVASDAKIAIIHTNDMHGFDLPADPTETSPGVIGIASVAQLKQDYEAQGYQVLLLDSGDATQGNVLVNLSQGAAAIEFMNAADFDAMTIGNHEFDWGADNLEQRIAEARFPVLAANVIVDATGELFARDNVVLTLGDGTKVGVFGLATPETQTKSSPKNVAGLTFLAGEDLYACAQRQVEELQEQGCSLIVALGHLGSIGGVSPNRSIDVLENTTGIDLFIDGHDHEVVNQTVNGSLLVSTGCYLENIGVVLYEGGALSEQMVAYGSYADEDKATADLVVKTHDAVTEQLSETIGTTVHALNGERNPGVRTEETNLGDYAADALLWQARQASGQDIDAAIVNGGSIRASIDAGPITRETVLTVFPYNNSLNVVTLSGAELLEVLEAATFNQPEESGGFPQVSGIEYKIDTTVAYQSGEPYPHSTYFAPAAPGSRVTVLDVGGKGFSLDADYTIAASSFITSGGDTYYAVAAAYAENGYITGYSDTDALINYIKDELGGVIGDEYATAQQRIWIAIE